MPHSPHEEAGFTPLQADLRDSGLDLLHGAAIGDGTTSVSVRAGQEDASAFMQPLRKDVASWRLLPEVFLPLWQESSPTLLALVFSQTSLLYEEDMLWLIEYLKQEADEPVQRKLVQLIRGLFRIGIPMVGFTLVGMSLAACVERETEIR